MPHLPPVKDGDAPQSIKPIFRALHDTFGLVPNIFRTMAHKPEVLEAVTKLNAAIQKDLPPRFRELAYLKASLVNHCGYCSHYHKLAGEKASLTEAQIAAADDFAASDLFDDREIAVMRFAEQLTRDAKVEAATMDELKSFLSESQLVVLAATVGLANFTNRFNHAFDVELP